MAKKLVADMHIHSNESDGVLKPEEIIRIAQKIPNMAAISITDHDTVEGSRKAINYPDKKIEFIPGIEFSCEKNSEEVHILGYYIDVGNEILSQTEKRLLRLRERRIHNFINKLNENGIRITIEDVHEYSTGKAVGRPHLAQAIFHHGYTQTMEEAYGNYLSAGCATYVPRSKMTVEEAMRVIECAGGISVIAHPSSLKNQNIVKEIIGMGIMGIEVYHPMNSNQNIEDYLKLAKENNLFITGGSDFHSSQRAGRPLFGQYNINYDHVKRMKKYSLN
jgi:hypothetical protein